MTERAIAGVLLLVAAGGVSWFNHRTNSQWEDALRDREEQIANYRARALADSLEERGWATAFGAEITEEGLRSLRERSDSLALLAERLQVEIQQWGRVRTVLEDRVRSTGVPVQPVEPGDDAVMPTVWAGTAVTDWMTSPWEFTLDTVDMVGVLDQEFYAEIPADWAVFDAGDEVLLTITSLVPQATIQIEDFVWQKPVVTCDECSSSWWHSSYAELARIGLGFAAGVWASR